jgi:hypothetical protein
MNPRKLILGAGLLIAAYLAFFGNKTPTGEIAEPVARAERASASARRSEPSDSPRSQARGEKSSASTGSTISVLAIRPRDQLMGVGQAQPHPDGLFSSHSWTPPPPPPPPPAPPPKPTAPPLPFAFIGKKMEDGKWEVYLSHGDQTYVARDKSELEGVYRVESIKPPFITFLYLPLKETQVLPIGGDDGAPSASSAAPAAPPHQASVKLQGPQKAKVGSTFDVQISLDPGQPVSNYSATIGYDINALEITGISEGDFLKQGGAPSVFNKIVQGPGEIAISGTRLGNEGIASPGVLVTISVKARAPAKEARIQVLNLAAANAGGAQIAAPQPALFSIAAQP